MAADPTILRQIACHSSMADRMPTSSPGPPVGAKPVLAWPLSQYDTPQIIHTHSYPLYITFHRHLMKPIANKKLCFLATLVLLAHLSLASSSPAQPHQESSRTHIMRPCIYCSPICESNLLNNVTLIRIKLFNIELAFINSVF